MAVQLPRQSIRFLKALRPVVAKKPTLKFSKDRWMASSLIQCMFLLLVNPLVTVGIQTNRVTGGYVLV